MATAGPSAPGTTADDSAVGTLAWSQTDRVKVDGVSNAFALTFDVGVIRTHYLKVTNFGFAIPSGATINGVAAMIDRSGTNSGSQWCIDATVKLVKGGTVSGNDKADTSTKYPASLTQVTYGGTSDLWGLTLTDTDVNASTFGFVLSTNVTSAGGAQANVDYMTMTITYTEGGGGGGPVKQMMHYKRLRQ